MKAARSITSVLIISMISGIFNPSPLLAQKKENKEHFRIELQIGNRNIQRDSLPSGDNMDFMNYLYQAQNSADYGYVGLNLSFAPNPKWAFNIKTVLLSDMIPSQLNFDVQYRFDSINPIFHWGLMGSVFAYPQYLEDFNRFHMLTDTGFTADLNTNFRQVTIFDMGVAAGPFLRFRHKRFHGQLSLRAGFCGFAPFDELITQKKTQANLRREVSYKTDYSPAVFVYPEAEAGFDVMNTGRTSIGILLRAGGLFSKRSINYTRTTLTWTTENAGIDVIKPKKQLYSKMEIEGGIYIRF